MIVKDLIKTLLEYNLDAEFSVVADGKRVEEWSFLYADGEHVIIGAEPGECIGKGQSQDVADEERDFPTYGSLPFGVVLAHEGKPWFRYDYDSCDPKEAWDIFLNVQEGLRRHGWYLDRDAQVEHDCITGYIKRYT